MSWFDTMNRRFAAGSKFLSASGNSRHDCHRIEVDLLSHGRHVLCIPEWRVKSFKPYDPPQTAFIVPGSNLSQPQSAAFREARPDLFQG